MTRSCTSWQWLWCSLFSFLVDMTMAVHSHEWWSLEDFCSTQFCALKPWFDVQSYFALCPTWVAYAICGPLWLYCIFNSARYKTLLCGCWTFEAIRWIGHLRPSEQMKNYQAIHSIICNIWSVYQTLDWRLWFPVVERWIEHMLPKIGPSSELKASFKEIVLLLHFRLISHEHSSQKLQWK